MTFEFEWNGDHPAANFVNTLDERLADLPEERLVSYRALLDFVQQAALIDTQTAASLMPHADSRVGETALAAAIAFREALFSVLWAAIRQTMPDVRSLAQVDSSIQSAHAARSLRFDSLGFVWAWKVPDSPSRPLWELALSAEQLLLSEPIQRLKKCAADDCGVLFVDHSRAGARRWCSMAGCGNRHKVQAFRSSRKQADRDL
ncbi:MAG: CGNR zinc finger domain-containing protein [Anaerolineae bacterium]